MEKQLRYNGRVDTIRGPNGVSSGGNYLVVHQNSRTGSSNPGWRARLRSGTFTASDYWRNSLDANFQGGSCGLYWDRTNNGVVERCFTLFSGDGTLINGLGIPSLVHSTADVNKALSTANSRLLDKIRRETTETQGITILGELRETIGMMRRPMQGSVRLLDNYARAMKRRAVDSRTRRQFLNGLTDQYLELVFGWRPLISDVLSLARTAARVVSDRRPLKRLVGTAEAEPYSSYYALPSVGAFDCIQRLSSVTNGDLSVQAIAYLKTELKGPQTPLEKIIQLSGFNLENFVPSVYDLIPFSFVLDYFSNLGDVISGATACQVAVVGSQQSVRQIVTRKESLSFDFEKTKSNVGGRNHRQSGSSGGSVEYKKVDFRRTTGLSVPVPSLHLELPGVQQVTNLAALVSGFFSGIHPPRR